jgi:hypothetical protein
MSRKSAKLAVDMQIRPKNAQAYTWISRIKALLQRTTPLPV